VDYKVKYLPPTISIELEFENSPEDAEVERVASAELVKSGVKLGAIIDMERTNYNRFIVTFEYSGEAV